MALSRKSVYRGAKPRKPCADKRLIDLPPVQTASFLRGFESI